MAKLDAMQELLDEAHEIYDLYKDAPSGSPTEKFALQTLGHYIVPALIAALEHPNTVRTGFHKVDQRDP